MCDFCNFDRFFAVLFENVGLWTNCNGYDIYETNMFGMFKMLTKCAPYFEGLQHKQIVVPYVIRRFHLRSPRGCYDGIINSKQMLVLVP
jgi:hypothetical protein